MKRKAPKVISHTVDLDTFDCALEQGMGSGVAVARIDFLQGGKRVSVILDLFQHEMKRDPTCRMTAITASKSVTREVSIKPWVIQDE